jgi:hypothetical protein
VRHSDGVVAVNNILPDKYYSWRVCVVVFYFAIYCLITASVPLAIFARVVRANVGRVLFCLLSKVIRNYMQNDAIILLPVQNETFNQFAIIITPVQPIPVTCR